MADAARKHYEQHFKSEDYRQMLIERDGGKMRQEEQFFFKSVAELFEESDVRGEALLDVGSGPTVHHLAPACGRFQHFFLSEFSAESRDALSKWLRADADALDWSRLLRQAAGAQGYGDPEAGRVQIETSIRKAVRAVMPCDVLASHVLPQEAPQTYDLVLTCLTLESAAPDYDAFKACLRKIHALIKPAGALVMKGYLNGGAWTTGKQNFPYLKLSQEDIQNALEEASFEDVRWKIFPRQDTEYHFQFDACYSLLCTKMERK